MLETIEKYHLLCLGQFRLTNEKEYIKFYIM